MNMGVRSSPRLHRLKSRGDDFLCGGIACEMSPNEDFGAAPHISHRSMLWDETTSHVCAGRRMIESCHMPVKLRSASETAHRMSTTAAGEPLGVWRIEVEAICGKRQGQKSALGRASMTTN
jgi:hypothetical protein